MIDVGRAIIKRKVAGFRTQRCHVHRQCTWFNDAPPRKNFEVKSQSISEIELNVSLCHGYEDHGTHPLGWNLLTLVATDPAQKIIMIRPTEPLFPLPSVCPAHRCNSIQPTMLTSVIDRDFTGCSLLAANTLSKNWTTRTELFLAVQSPFDRRCSPHLLEFHRLCLSLR